MNAKVVLLGATGYTGGLILESLLARGIRPVLAGRSPDRLAALAREHGGLPTAVVDAGEQAAVRRLLEPRDVVISTVGPFERFGEPVAAAAADAGARYLDTTGEVGFVRLLQQRHARRAAETGAVLLPAFGYDYVPGILAGALAAERAGAAGRVLDVAYFVTGATRRGLSQGTRATLLDGLTLPSYRRLRGELIQQRTAARVRNVATADGRRKDAILASGTEVLFLPARYPNLTSVTVWNGWFPAMSRLISLAAAVPQAAARTATGQRVLHVLTRPLIGAPGGPDAAERARTRTQVVATVAGADTRQLAVVQLEGPGTYTLTGELIAWAAQELLDRAVVAPGVVGPVEAFGLETLRAGCAGIGLEQV